jgi:hypothetical protein
MTLPSRSGLTGAQVKALVCGIESGMKAPPFPLQPRQMSCSNRLMLHSA